MSHLGVIGLFFCGITMAYPAMAASLPEGDCANPKPYTDLTHCRYKRADLRDKDLRSADLRRVNFYQTQLQGADLTGALIDGRSITYAFLDGVIGLPADALEILKTQYLVSMSDKGDLSISALPSGHKVRYEDVAGLDNIELARNANETQNTIALLAYPRYGEYQKAAIFARFDKDKFDFPACYGSLDLLKGDGYYYPQWTSMKLKALANGDYLIGVRATGSDGDDMGSGGWDMVAFLSLTAACKLTLLHKVNSTWAEDSNHTGCSGEHPDYRFLDDRTAELVMTTHTCGAKSKSKVTRKAINLR